jgi:hypothetical protein
MLLLLGYFAYQELQENHSVQAIDASNFTRYFGRCWMSRFPSIHLLNAIVFLALLAWLTVHA